MTEEKKEFTKEDFIAEMTDFEQNTANEILEILEKHKHILSVEVLGLISIARVLINTYGDEYLMDTAVRYLTFTEPEPSDVPEADNIIKDEE